MLDEVSLVYSVYSEGYCGQNLLILSHVVVKADSFARLNHVHEPLSTVKLDVMLELAEAVGAQDDITVAGCLKGAIRSIHCTHERRAVPQTEDMTDLVDHGVACSLQPD